MEQELLTLKCFIGKVRKISLIWERKGFFLTAVIWSQKYWENITGSTVLFLCSSLGTDFWPLDVMSDTLRSLLRCNEINICYIYSPRVKVTASLEAGIWLVRRAERKALQLLWRPSATCGALASYRLVLSFQWMAGTSRSGVTFTERSLTRRDGQKEVIGRNNKALDCGGRAHENSLHFLLVRFELKFCFLFCCFQ